MQPTDSICHSFLHEVPQVLLAILCQYYVLDVLWNWIELWAGTEKAPLKIKAYFKFLISFTGLSQVKI